MSKEIYEKDWHYYVDRGSDYNLIRYIGYIGDFVYNDKEFELQIQANDEDTYLQYIGNGENVRLPEGCVSCKYMFSDCGLERLDLSNFSTRDVYSMHGMFYDCRKLKELKLGNFDTSKVARMSYMFSGCRNLKSLLLGNFNTENVEDMSDMFAECFLYATCIFLVLQTIILDVWVLCFIVARVYVV